MSFDKIPGAGVPDNSGVASNKKDTVKTEKSVHFLNIGQYFKSLSKEEREKLDKQLQRNSNSISDVETLQEKLKNPVFVQTLKQYFSDEEIANLTPAKMRELDKALNESNKFEKPATEKSIELSDISKKINAMSEEEIEKLMKQYETDNKSSDKNLKIEEKEAQLEKTKAEYNKKIDEIETDKFLRNFVSEAELKTLNSTQKKVLEAEYKSLKNNKVIE